jgi:hypothetical protein
LHCWQHGQTDNNAGKTGVITGYTGDADDPTCHINFGDGQESSTVRLSQLPFKIAIPLGTSIDCEKLVGQEVEVLIDGVYYGAFVKRANADIAANFLRFVNGDKQWMDLSTRSAAYANTCCAVHSYS